MVHRVKLRECQIFRNFLFDSLLGRVLFLTVLLVLLTQLVPLSCRSRRSIVLGLDDAETRRRRCVFPTRHVGLLLESALKERKKGALGLGS